MALTATYVDATAKVTLSITSAPSNAQTVLIERSTDGVSWTTVRGASTLTLTSGAVSIDDYEFSDGVSNNYRASYFDSTAPASVGTAAAATAVTSAGASASVTPTMPTGLGPGDAVFVAVANTKATATLPAAPTGWVFAALDGGGVALYVTDWKSSLTIPTFTVTGLASGDIVVGKAFSMRNVAGAPSNVQAQDNASAQNIAYPAFGALPGSANAGPMIAFKRSTNTAVTPSPTTNDKATGWSLLVFAENPAATAGGTITMTGGAAATSNVIQASMAARAFVSQETGAVTPALSTTWLKNPLQPYLNRAVTVISIDTIVNAARSATFNVINRTFPVAVTDVFGGRKTNIVLRVTDENTLVDLRDCLMTGQVQMLQAPNGSRTPTGYFVLGDLSEQFPSNTGSARYLAFSVTEVATPSPTLAAVQSTYQTVLTTYATYAAVLAAKATYADLLQLVGSPSDVITG